VGEDKIDKHTALMHNAMALTRIYGLDTAIMLPLHHQKQQQINNNDQTFLTYNKSDT